MIEFSPWPILPTKKNKKKIDISKKDLCDICWNSILKFMYMCDYLWWSSNFKQVNLDLYLVCVEQQRSVASAADEAAAVATGASISSLL